MIFTPVFARSAGLAIPAGFDAGTMTVRRLVANFVTGATAKPSSTSDCGFFVSAERKTSAGAPCSIFVASAVDESVEIVSVAPGFAASYAALSFASGFFREAAA